MSLFTSSNLSSAWPQSSRLPSRSSEGELTHIVTDEADADRILRRIYQGRRPARVHLLICACGEMADLHDDPGAWNGWQILPHARCPKCLAERQLVQWDLQPVEARARFLALVERLGVRKES